MTIGERRVLVALPTTAKDLENALHAACDLGTGRARCSLFSTRTQTGTGLSWLLRSRLT